MPRRHRHVDSIMSEVLFNAHDVVLLMTAYQCLLFALLLLTLVRERRLSHWLLALFLLQYAAIPLDVLISFGEKFREVALSISPNLFYVFGFGYWLEAPLLLWYTRSLIYKNYRLRWRDGLYLLPFVFYLVHQLVSYYSMPFEAKMELQQNYQLELAPHYMNFVTLFRELFRVALGCVCLWELRRYREHIKDRYANIEKIDLSWLKLLVIGFLVIRTWALVVAFFVLLAIVYGINLVDFTLLGLAGNYTTFLLVSVLIFFSLRQSSLYEGIDHSARGPARAEERESPDPARVRALLDVMERDCLYRKPLTLDRLAERVGMAPRALSRLINRRFECNFFEFVNGYRIEEARNRLADPEWAGHSVLSIMHEAGFNSKATFNTLFKQKVGSTPSEYRKRHANSEGAL